MEAILFEDFFDQCPGQLAWSQFFTLHGPFWRYITETAKTLFNVPMSYPIPMEKEALADYKGTLSSLEDFFALYFLLIIYQQNKDPSKNEFQSDQLMWKHLWQRELWSKRVSPEKFVEALRQMKEKLMLAPKQESFAQASPSTLSEIRR